jgi:hypothetical protein
MPSPMPAPYCDLARALDLWTEAGRTALFWWRDDDAAEPTAALTRLSALSEEHGIEVAVAVVPARATDALPAALRHAGNVAVLQHGYEHRNHAPAGAPAVECGGVRPVEEVLGELSEGRRRLTGLLGARALPILAAPWNRIDRPVLERLKEAGFRGASAFGPRAAMHGAHALAIANAHVDPMNWRARRFAGVEKALSGILGELQARLTGAADPEEPLGLLTHHLDHDEELWTFLEEFFRLTQKHPAARWITTAEAFSKPPAAASRQGALAG